MRKLKILLILILFIANFAGAQSFFAATNGNSTLYYWATENSAVIARLPAGTVVLVEDTAFFGKFFPVINIVSGAEGYVLKSAVELTSPADESPSGNFKARAVNFSDSATVRVTNITDRTITLKINDINHYIASGGDLLITLAPGRYKYFVFGARFIPFVGVEKFEKSKKYSWQISNGTMADTSR